MKILEINAANTEQRPAYYDIGITFSQFDVIHAGHIAMLAYAKTHCSYLIVGLQTDASIDRPEKNKPLQSVFERQLILSSIKYIDEIVVYTHEMEIIDILATLQTGLGDAVDIQRFLGEEYEGKSFTGWDLKGINNHFHTRPNRFSSSNLRTKF